MSVTDNVKSGWLNIVRRLQGCGKTQGMSVLTIRVLVDAEGDPVLWTQPERVLLEPKSVCGTPEQLAALIVALTK